ncbi:hypothetical protein AQUCO_01400949v1 [Aquilegia coerulea]|uniref:Homeobox domain-containing protein n=1 Tax=Aquilegia coerulea TaxID=218851 RepID=A0A2G5DYY1_AQUCA|nr:hypothetical protein AQUCO_01400949v1 [Aquilegia coerulea]
MEGQDASCPSPSSRPAVGSSAGSPVRSRWTPKPEQILILESIFNSGMVNPPKDETVRIRKLLEKFGSVGDVNVFYWFQNRRSRSRRRQRQIQAGLLQTPNNNNNNNTSTTSTTTSDQYKANTILIDHHHHQAYNSPAAALYHHYEPITSSTTTISVGGFASSQHIYPPTSPCVVGTSSSSSSSSSSTSTSAGGGAVNANDLFSISQQMSSPHMDQNSILCPSSDMQLYQSGGSIVTTTTTVFINGIATEVPSGSFDLSAMFGQDHHHHVMLVHSSTGVPVPVNEYGILMQSLQMGESYFLVIRLLTNLRDQSP